MTAFVSILQLLSISVCFLSAELVHGNVPISKDKSNGSPGLEFSCAGKVIGGYYADVYENCQVFHVCTIGEKGEIRDIVFRCLNGTVFDQETRVCERQEEVDCTKSRSFFHLNNELYGPGIIPDTAADLKQASGQTLRQKSRHNKTTLKRDMNLECKGKTGATFFSDSTTQCKNFELCIPQQHPRSDLVRSFVCAGEGYSFDPTVGKCLRSEHVQCPSDDASFSIPVEKAEYFAVFAPGLCSFFGKEAFLIDILSECEQYIQCPIDDEQAISVFTCPDGFLFSQNDQKCIKAHSVSCQRDIYSLMKLIQLKVSHTIQEDKHLGVKRFKEISMSPLNSILKPHSRRRRRALSFEDGNPHREVSSRSLTNIAGIFSDQVSVIEANQNPGNVIEGKISNPEMPTKFHRESRPTSQFDIIYQKDKANPTIRPETTLGFNKTTLNGATIEVNEITSPDHKGKVTITSVVPKLVRQNGNGAKAKTPNNHIPSTIPTFASDGRTKITLLGSNSPWLDQNQETINEDPIKVEKIDELTTLNSDVQIEEENVTEDLFFNEDSFTESSVTADIEMTTFDDNEITTEIAMDLEEDSETEQVTAIDDSLTESQTTIVIPTSIEISTSTTPATTTIASTTTTTTTTTSTTASSTTTSEPTTISPPTSTVDEDNSETNFTCKDKELDQFYPDLDKNCRIFHYCSPGFTDDEILDLTFVCSENTRFDIETKKCQDMSTVVCKQPEATTIATTTTTTTTASTITQSTSTTTTPSTTTTTTPTSSTTIPSTTATTQPTTTATPSTSTTTPSTTTTTPPSTTSTTPSTTTTSSTAIASSSTVIAANNETETIASSTSTTSSTTSSTIASDTNESTTTTTSPLLELSTTISNSKETITKLSEREETNVATSTEMEMSKENWNKKQISDVQESMSTDENVTIEVPHSPKPDPMSGEEILEHIGMTEPSQIFESEVEAEEQESLMVEPNTRTLNVTEADTTAQKGEDEVKPAANKESHVVPTMSEAENSFVSTTVKSSGTTITDIYSQTTVEVTSTPPSNDKLDAATTNASLDLDIEITTEDFMDSESPSEIDQSETEKKSGDTHIETTTSNLPSNGVKDGDISPDDDVSFQSTTETFEKDDIETEVNTETVTIADVSQ